MCLSACLLQQRLLPCGLKGGWCARERRAAYLMVGWRATCVGAAEAGRVVGVKQAAVWTQLRWTSGMCCLLFMLWHTVPCHVMVTCMVTCNTCLGALVCGADCD